MEVVTLLPWRNQSTGEVVSPPRSLDLPPEYVDRLWSAGCVRPVDVPTEPSRWVRFAVGKGGYKPTRRYRLPELEAGMWVRRGFAIYCTEEGAPLPCDETTPRCGAAQRLRQPTPACCIAHVTTMLVEIDEALTGAGLSWWMDYGTLLGAVREGGQIPHDKDGDIGVLAEEWEAVQDALQSLEAKGRTVWVKPHREGKYAAGGSIKFRLSKTNTTNVDIFPWYRNENGERYRINYIGADRCKGREFPEERLLPLQRLPYFEHEFPAPADPLWFVEHRYGEGWRVPINTNHDGRRR